MTHPGPVFRCLHGASASTVDKVRQSLLASGNAFDYGGARGAVYPKRGARIGVRDVQKVAIIGSGPAGLSAAARAAALGLQPRAARKDRPPVGHDLQIPEGQARDGDTNPIWCCGGGGGGGVQRRRFRSGQARNDPGIWDEQIAGHKVNVKYHRRSQGDPAATGDAIPGSVQQIVMRARDGTKDGSRTSSATPRLMPSKLTNGEVVMAENVILAIGNAGQSQPDALPPCADLPHVAISAR